MYSFSLEITDIDNDEDFPENLDIDFAEGFHGFVYEGYIKVPSRMVKGVFGSGKVEYGTTSERLEESISKSLGGEWKGE